MAKKRRGPTTPAVTATTPAYVPGIPVFSANAVGTITFTFTESGTTGKTNSDKAEYAIYDNINGNYIDLTGASSGGSETWAVFADWDNGGVDGKVTVTGLAAATAYTFKVKARNEAAVETGFSANSASFMTDQTLTCGDASDALNREVPTGNTKINLDGYGTSIPIEITGTFGDISVKYFLQNNNTTTSRIVVEFSEDDVTYAAATEGTGGDGVTGLTTNAVGIEHEYIWDSYTDAGLSEQDDTVYLRITPYDASPAGGDAGAARTSDAFPVDNRPGVVTLLNSDGFTFAKDTTPTFQAIMVTIRGGTHLFFRLIVEDSNDVQQFDTGSGEVLDGWEYEDGLTNWTQVPVTGVPAAKIDGANKIRYTIQSWNEITADNDNPYRATMKQCEDTNT
ncbi:hypothetical protein KAR91_18585 [Candidatus Pacearchaeota archaeon]|nr:hypothetical protein [Candidatus Pacearchaeota archaeon]